MEVLDLFTISEASVDLSAPKTSIQMDIEEEKKGKELVKDLFVEHLLVPATYDNEDDFELTKPNTSATSKQVLIVDDNMFNSCAVERLFAQFDFECDICPGGYEAIQQVMERC